MPMNLESEKVKQLIATIVETAHPLRILVFGSVARGEATEHSDVDLLVVMPDGVHRRKTGQSIDMALLAKDCDVPTDVIVATEGDLITHGDKPYYIYRDALHEGKEVYRAA